MKEPNGNQLSGKYNTQKVTAAAYRMSFKVHWRWQKIVQNLRTDQCVIYCQTRGRKQKKIRGFQVSVGSNTRSNRSHTV